MAYDEPQPEQSARAARAVTVVGLATLAIALYATWQAQRHCRELGCLVVVWLWGAIGASLLAALPGLASRLASRPIFRGRAARGVAIAIGLVGLGFAWFVLLATWDSW